MTPEVKIKNYSMIAHMNCYPVHYHLNEGEFDCEGLPLHGRKVRCEASVRQLKSGEYKDVSKIFYLSEPKSKQFKTIEALIEHYNGKKNG